MYNSRLHWGIERVLCSTNHFPPYMHFIRAVRRFNSSEWKPYPFLQLTVNSLSNWRNCRAVCEGFISEASVNPGSGQSIKKKPTFSYSDNKTSLHQKDIKNVCTSLIKLDKQIINFLWSFKHQAIFIFMWLHTYHLGGGALNYRSFFLNKTELVSNIKQLFIGTILYTTTLFKFSPTE